MSSMPLSSVRECASVDTTIRLRSLISSDNARIPFVSLEATRPVPFTSIAIESRAAFRVVAQQRRIANALPAATLLHVRLTSTVDDLAARDGGQELPEFLTINKRLELAGGGSFAEAPPNAHGNVFLVNGSCDPNTWNCPQVPAVAGGIADEDPTAVGNTAIMRNAFYIPPIPVPQFASPVTGTTPPSLHPGDFHYGDR